MKMKSTGKAVLVTGVSSGIGLGLAQHLSAEGHLVFGSVRSREVAEQLGKALGGNFRGLVFDVTDKAAMTSARNRVEAELDGTRLAALVNNAGLALFGPLQLIDDEDFEQLIKVNLFGVRNAINTFLPLLGVGADAGKIINVSSLSGIFNTPMNGAYCISKHALESLGEIYRRELYQYGIDVVSIRPGPIQSQIWEKNFDAVAAYRDSDYGSMAARAGRIMRGAQRHAQSPEVIGRLVCDIVEGRKKGSSYMIDRRKWLTFVLARLLPPRWVDRLIWRQLSAPRG